MKLSTWAKQNGISYKTAWRLFKNGKLPVKATQLATGTIIIELETKTKGNFCPNCGERLA